MAVAKRKYLETEYLFGKVDKNENLKAEAIHVTPMLHRG